MDHLPSFASRTGRFDQLPADQLLDETRPALIGSIRGEQLALVQPRRYGSGPAITIPVTTSRLERDRALRRGYDPGPYVPSLAGLSASQSRYLVVTAVVVGALLIGMQWRR
jgi:hypothetical protein